MHRSAIAQLRFSRSLQHHGKMLAKIRLSPAAFPISDLRTWRHQMLLPVAPQTAFVLG
jgi:hypothetical protein